MRSSKRKNRATPSGRPGSCSAAAGNRGGRRAVGVLGGIFDPVHNGHCALADRARKYFRLSKVLFVPSGRPPHKERPCAAPADRLAMLCLALRDRPDAAVWDGELRRKGASYTFDTLRALGREFPKSKFYFIVGSDNLAEIPAWHRFRDVLAMVTVCAARRPGFPLAVPAALRAAAVKKFPSPDMDVSSTDIRERIAAGRPYRRLVPREVAEYISIRKLYRRR